MKRLVSWILVALLALSALPALAYTSVPVQYGKNDLNVALSGLGRMPKEYYNLASAIISAGIGDVSSEQAQTTVRRLYSFWSFLSTKSYRFAPNQRIKDVMTQAQWSSITTYLSNLAYNYGTPELYNVFVQYLNMVTTNSLQQVAAPMGLLGVCFDPATVGGESVIKIYTTTDIDNAKVDVTLPSGTSISAEKACDDYPGNLASFREHRIKLKPFSAAGTYNVRVYVSDAGKNSYITYSLSVSPATSGGSTQKTTVATVKSVSTNKVSLGDLTAITVQTNVGTTDVKVTNSSGAILALSSAPSSSTTSSKTFALEYGFNKVGSTPIRVYSGYRDTLNQIVWNSTYKAATVTVNAAASTATISKITATNPYRGEAATIAVYTSLTTARVMLKDSTGSIVDYSDDFSVVGKSRMFLLSFTSTQAKTHKLNAYAGDQVSWNGSAKSVSVTVLAPYVVSISSTKPRINTPATITVKGSPTAIKASLFDANKALLYSTTEKDVSGNFVFDSWVQSTPGSKRIYVLVEDAYGPSAYKSGTVTFVR